MITINLSGGHTRMLKAKVIDDEGVDLSEVTFKIAVALIDSPPPAAASDQWRTPTSIEYPSDGEAIIRLLLNESIMPPGNDYWAWVLPNTGDSAEPVRASDDILRAA